MKFRLLEIESIQRSSGFERNNGQNRPVARKITLRISPINPGLVEHIKNIAAQYSRMLAIESYSKAQLTITVDLAQMAAFKNTKSTALKSISAYTKELRQNLAFCRAEWETTYGFDFSQPRIMGVINVTPDSFSDGGKFFETGSAIDQAFHLIEQGADIIDIGGESTRPGAAPVTVEQELDRVLPVIESIRRKSDIPISIDTYKAKVARTALDAGANWINDITGLRMDPEMIQVAAETGVPVVIMHMQGTPETMQTDPAYENVVLEIVDYFEERIQTLKKQGIDKIILDPGIGFGKQLNHNITLLQNLLMFKQFGYPLLIGTSRKSFLGAITGQDVDQREAGTLASVVWSVLHGVNLVRVHAVTGIGDTLRIINVL